jgi:hypothetical protein
MKKTIISAMVAVAAFGFSGTSFAASSVDLNTLITGTVTSTDANGSAHFWNPGGLTVSGSASDSNGYTCVSVDENYVDVGFHGAGSMSAGVSGSGLAVETPTVVMATYTSSAGISATAGADFCASPFNLAISTGGATADNNLGHVDVGSHVW